MSCSIRVIQAMNNLNPNFHVISMKCSHVFQVSESQNEPQTEAVVRRFSVTKTCNFIKKNTAKFLRIHFFIEYFRWLLLLRDIRSITYTNPTAYQPIHSEK